jgi:integrase
MDRGGRARAGDGKRRQRRVTAPNKTEAAERLRELQAQVRAGLCVDPNSQTVAELLDRWMEIERSAKTKETYEIAIRLRLKPYLGRIKAQVLRAGHVQNMVSTLQKRGDGKRAIELAVAVLSRCLNWAVRLDELPKNVAQFVTTPRVSKKKPVVLTPEQARALFDVTSGTTLELIVKLALLRAMRRGEILGLLLSDVGLTARTITITGSLQRTGHELRRDAPKTESSRRVLHIPELLAEALAAYIRRREQDGPLDPHDYLLVSTRGTPLEPRNVNRSFSRALKRAKLPPMRLHDLRHSSASIMIAAGSDIKTGHTTLGHASSRTTLAIYSWAMPEAHRVAAELLERSIGQ